ncbi:hypothetical protein Pfo_000931 [Paulownia fortunei]|nr:hypothetical protein Pfo_000931 [Paulownia fortunei]
MAALMKRDRSIKFFDLEIKSLITKEECRDKVYKVVDPLTGTNYVLKEFNSLYDSSNRAEISREIEILKKLDHPNLVKCHEVYDIGDRIYLLLEHMDRGSLVGDDITSESALASIAHQVLLGLRYLHQNKISHGDIKPSNIFINSMEQVKVLYLGKILSKTPVVLTEIGAIHDEFSWDVWSVGLCILKLFKGLNWGCRDIEFDEVNGSEEVPKSPQNEGALVQKPSIELLRFLLCCMQTETDVSKRWTAEELVRNPFFEQLSASLLKKKKESHAFLFEACESTISHEDLHTLQFYEEEEQISPKTKKPKISIEEEEGIYDVESSEDPTPTVPLGHFGRCIDHCTLFLPDCEFEKDKLVQLWIAEECIELEATNRMEDVGNLYFDALVHEEIIIPSKFDNLYRQMKYKVSTSKASTWFLKRSNYVRIDEGNLDEIYGEALHLTWHCRTLDRTLFDALKNFNHLRTLLVLVAGSALVKQLPNDIFLGLKLLRTLDLSRTHISELPGSIGILELLRYLDVSETPIKQLPESTDRLYLLQTLKLKGCFGLFALPRGLGRLINLRHLDLHMVGQLKSMPRGMGNLIKLQTLQAFLVGKNDGCGIGELKNMNEITGSFCISRLENVSSAEEAKEAALGDKQHIDKLQLRWNGHGNDNSHDTLEIIECLQPHFHLRELEIIFYSGSKLPSWISNPSFTDLSSITLYKCINCDILPSIGELPSLKILRIVEMMNVRDINTLFCRNHGTQGFNAFPRLEKLTLENMFNLEEWTGIEDGDFPCLRHISIRYCPKLFVLPSLSVLCSLQHLEINHCLQLVSLPEGLLPGSLETLIIKGCPKIYERCLKDGGEDWFKIADVQNIWIDIEKISLD